MLIEKINEIIQNEIEPRLAEHGGSIKLVDFKDGVIYVKLFGACSGCPSAKFTMEDLVENAFSNIPEIKSVRLDTSVNEEMLDFAKNLLKHKNN